MKNSSDTIGNRTRDLPACSAVPQLDAPPRTQLLRALCQKYVAQKVIRTKLNTVTNVKKFWECNFLGCHAAFRGNSLPTFQDNLSV